MDDDIPMKNLWEIYIPIIARQLISENIGKVPFTDKQFTNATWVDVDCEVSLAFLSDRHAKDDATTSRKRLMAHISRAEGIGIAEALLHGKVIKDAWIELSTEHRPALRCKVRFPSRHDIGVDEYCYEYLVNSTLGNFVAVALKDDYRNVINDLLHENMKELTRDVFGEDADKVMKGVDANADGIVH